MDPWKAAGKRYIDFTGKERSPLTGNIAMNMSSGPFSAIDHVQIAAPMRCEDAARRFYGEILGMQEMAKPAALAMRGGVWFTSGGVQIHIGVDVDFRPARKAHPGLCCSDYDALLRRLRSAGVEVEEVNDIRELRRAYIHDPFGNRIELIAEANVTNRNL